MPPDTEGLRRWPAPLSGRLPDDADAALIAQAVGDVWRDIDSALSPIIGHRGVAALFQRSVKLTLPAHAWLAELPQGALAAIDPSALTAALQRQPATEAAIAGCSMFGTFRALLASLVGASLTERLLHPVWASTKGQAPTQEHLP